MKYNRLFWFGMALFFLVLEIVVVVELRLYDLSVCAVLMAVGLGSMYGALFLEEWHFLKERRKRTASIYSDWERSDEERIMIDEPQQPIGAYGKSFHSLNIRKLVGNLKAKGGICPRCQGLLWRREGSEYLNRGRWVRLWKCLSCGYEEERFSD